MNRCVVLFIFPYTAFSVHWFICWCGHWLYIYNFMKNIILGHSRPIICYVITFVEWNISYLHYRLFLLNILWLNMPWCQVIRCFVLAHWPYCYFRSLHCCCVMMWIVGARLSYEMNFLQKNNSSVCQKDLYCCEFSVRVWKIIKIHLWVNKLSSLSAWQSWHRDRQERCPRENKVLIASISKV